MQENYYGSILTKLSYALEHKFITVKTCQALVAKYFLVGEKPKCEVQELYSPAGNGLSNSFVESNFENRFPILSRFQISELNLPKGSRQDVTKDQLAQMKTEFKALLALVDRFDQEIASSEKQRLAEIAQEKQEIRKAQEAKNASIKATGQECDNNSVCRDQREEIEDLASDLKETHGKLEEEQDKCPKGFVENAKDWFSSYHEKHCIK